MSSAEHVYIYDSDGNRMLDGMSGLWCCNLGYSQRSIIDAVYAQLQELPFYNNFFKCSNQPAAELASVLAEVTPAQFNHVFFTNSGSEANDTNIRLVHRYYDLLGKPDKKHIISRKNAYHGSTIAAASLGGMSAMHEQMQRLDFIHHINQPHWFAEGGGDSPEDFGIRVARELEAKIDELGEARVAAFIAEPVQGAGGVIIPPASYWPEIRRICDERDILLIMDEVICGFGRTGNWFGCETYGLQPDLMTIAKAVTNGYMPLGGVMVGDKVADVLLGHSGEFTHGLTYSGHPAACAAGLETIRLLRESDIIEQAAHQVAPHFQARLRELEDHPIVGEVRGLGMFAAVELVRDKGSRERLAPNSAGAVFCRDTRQCQRPDGAPDRGRHDYRATADLQHGRDRYPGGKAWSGPGPDGRALRHQLPLALPGHSLAGLCRQRRGTGLSNPFVLVPAPRCRLSGSKCASLTPWRSCQ